MEIVACYVVANEADHIAESLRSVKAYVDRYVIVDSLFVDNPQQGTHSSDATRSVALAACEGRPVQYIESTERLHEPEARNRYLEQTVDDWVLQMDGDEQLYGDHAGILDLLARVRLGRVVRGVDIPVYTVAVNFNGQADEMDAESYATNPLISTRGYQPRLFENRGVHYAYDGGTHGFGAALYRDKRYLEGSVKTADALIINHHTRQSFESYQNDYLWETAASRP
jgi:glycosyltransferase involved in cell wall biosynthesis